MTCQVWSDTQPFVFSEFFPNFGVSFLDAGPLTAKPEFWNLHGFDTLIRSHTWFGERVIRIASVPRI